MIKLFLCTIICGCTFLSATELHRQKTKEAEAARELCVVIGRAETLIHFEAADVFTVCEKVFEGVEAVDVAAFKSIRSGDFKSEWQAACDTLDVDAESKRIFRAVGQVMGSCDIESQTKRLSELRSELSEHAKNLSEKAESTKKLYASLGALLGAAVSVIFI